MSHFLLSSHAEPLRQEVDVFYISKRFEGHRGKTVVGFETPSYSGLADFGPWENIVPGVQFRTWTPEGAAGGSEDGALVKISPGAATPVQLVNEGTYREIPKIIYGKEALFCLIVMPDNQLYAYKFDGDSPSRMITVPKGAIMSFVASVHNDEREVLLIEHESPPWTQESLLTIEQDSDTGKAMPQAFWEIRNALINGIETHPKIITIR